MDFNKAKDYINNHIDSILTRDNSGQGYICPLCGSGSGNKGTGITTKDGKHFTCWACGDISNSDIFDIIGKKHGLTSYQEQIRKAVELVNYNEMLPSEQPAPKPMERKPKLTEQELAELQEKNRKLIALGMAHLTETDYLAKRGIDLNTARAFKLGYVKNYKGMGEAVIIPTKIDEGKHIARFLDNRKDKYWYAGNRELFNISILYTATTPIIITEGELDAISVVQAGGNAIGLGGTTGRAKLIKLIEQQFPKVPLILALDNDEYGERASTELAQDLSNLGYNNYIKVNLYGACKDANAALTSNKNSFTSTITAITKASNLEAIKETISQLKYTSSSAGDYVAEFLADIQNNRTTTPYIPTGFRKLDEYLEGGLYEGVHYIGALSSLGKTTFVMQIADNLARGQVDYTDTLQEKFPPSDVLIFSLEMGKKQLVAKSISRETFEYCLRNKLDTRVYPKTSRGITVGKRYARYNQNELDVIRESAKSYAGYGKHIYIIEGNGHYGTIDIKNAIQYHVDSTGRKPIVIVDYLQIIAPSKEKQTDKQATDQNVLDLKDISKQFSIPIICISSINRDNYKEKISMQAYKESGNIEYTSDVLIGLQLAGAGKRDFDVDTAKAKNPRDIELTILKNREAPICRTIQYEYMPAYNYFREKVKQ